MESIKSSYSCLCFKSQCPTIGPWEVFCGLPTVEIMRPLPIEVQARYLLATGDVDDIIVGNYPASTKELEALSKINFKL